MSEASIQRDILDYLEACPKVRWVRRINTGAVRKGGRYIRFGFVGCSDVIGMLKGGRFFAVEVKKPGEEPTPEQQQFIDMTNEGGGLAFWADSLDQVIDTFATVKVKVNAGG